MKNNSGKPVSLVHVEHISKDRNTWNYATYNLNWIDKHDQRTLRLRANPRNSNIY